MKYELKIPFGKLRAVALFASLDDTRAIIRNIRVEWIPDWVLLVATDGRRMAVIRTAYDGPAFEGWEFHPSVLKLVDTKHGARYFNRCAEEFGVGDAGVLSESAAVRVSWEEGADTRAEFRPYVSELAETLEAFAVSVPLLRWRYPDWRAVAAITHPVAAHPVVSLNGELLAAFTEAALALGYEPALLIEQHGQVGPGSGIGANVLRIALPCPDFFGLLMPVKADENECAARVTVPAWLSAR